MTVNLLDFDLEGLAAFCDRLGEKRFRATQLFRWIHQKGARQFDDMSDLAKSLRDKLKVNATVVGLPILSQHISADGTIKWLFDVGGGDAVGQHQSLTFSQIVKGLTAVEAPIDRGGDASAIAEHICLANGQHAQ